MHGPNLAPFAASIAVMALLFCVGYALADDVKLQTDAGASVRAFLASRLDPAADEFAVLAGYSRLASWLATSTVGNSLDGIADAVKDLAYGDDEDTPAADGFDEGTALRTTDGVRQLSPDHLETLALRTERFFAVGFFSPSCGHCTAMKPAWAAFAAALEERGFVAASMNAAQHSGWINSRDWLGPVRSYPTIRFFMGGAPDVTFDYTGARTADAMGVAFANFSHSSVRVLETAADVQAVLKAANVTVLGASPTTFALLSALDRHLRGKAPVQLAVAATAAASEAVLELASGASSLDTLVLFRPWPVVVDSPTSVLVPTLGVDDLAPLPNGKHASKTVVDTLRWIRVHQVPLLGALLPGIEHYYTTSGLEVGIIFVRSVIGDRGQFADFAHRNRERLSLVVLDIAKIHADLARVLPTLDTPALIINKPAGKGYDSYVSSKVGGVSAAEMFAFADEYFAGRATKTAPARVSQARAELNVTAPVVGFVGSEWDQWFTALEGPAFIMFYADWCGHCKALKPTWVELAVAAETPGSKIAGVRIAQYNADKNTVGDEEMFKVHGFPSLYFYDPVARSALYYDKGRKLEDLVKFVTAQAERLGVNAAAAAAAKQPAHTHDGTDL